MCPAIDEVITVDRIKMRDGPAWRAIIGMLRLMRDLRRRKFDATLDFHGFRETNLLTWWSGAPERWGLKRFDQSFFGFCFNRPPVVEDKSLHASEMFLRIVQGIAPIPTTAEPSPSLVVPSRRSLLGQGESSIQRLLSCSMWTRRSRKGSGRWIDLLISPITS